MKIRGICFDMDGVLTNTEGIGSEMLMRAVQSQGLTVTPAQWRTMIGANWENTCAMIRNYCGDTFDAVRFMDDWKKMTVGWMRENGVPLMPYARETLQKLHDDGYRIALCTSNARDVVTAYLTLSGLNEYFQAVITSDDVRRSKPSPDIYLAGAAALRLNPEECAGVEDSYNGVRSVRRAGLYSVMIPDQLPYTENLKFEVDQVLKHLNELPQMIGRHG